MPLKLLSFLVKKSKTDKPVVDSDRSEYIHPSKYTTELEYFLSTLSPDNITFTDNKRVIVKIIDPELEAEAIRRDRLFISQLINRLDPENPKPKLEFTGKSKFLLDKQEQGELLPKGKCADLDTFQARLLKIAGYKYITSKKTIGRIQYIFEHKGIKIVLTKPELEKIYNKWKFRIFS